MSDGELVPVRLCEREGVALDERVAVRVELCVGDCVPVWLLVDDAVSLGD